MPSVQDFPECQGSIFDCNSTIPTCRISTGFNFTALWATTEEYAAQCPGGPWLFPPPENASPNSIGDHLALTNDICKAIAGSDWTIYPSSDIWQRLTTWKFPLFQLVVNSPRPPLGFLVEGFTFVHFLGDPIGTISDILYTMDRCQTRAVFWQERLNDELASLCDGRESHERQRIWRSLAIIVVSFDEWGPETGDLAQAYLLAELSRLSATTEKTQRALCERYLETCFLTAGALAADRSTKALPVTIAQAFFIGSVAIAMIRTKSASDTSSSPTFINIEMYSIAFTAQYFWVIFVVVWTSIIGVSQTAGAIPRILKRLQSDLTSKFAVHGLKINLPTDGLNREDHRVYHGGVYSWQPARPWTLSSSFSSSHNSSITTPTHQPRHPLLPPKHQPPSSRPHITIRLLRSLILKPIIKIWPIIYICLPLFILATAAATGQIISALVPPVGWSCRSVGMGSIFITWVTSSILPLPFQFLNLSHRTQFWLTFLKDFLVVGVTFGIIIETQFGYYNRCDCYTRHGTVGLQLPMMPDVDRILKKQLRLGFPAVVAVGIAVQLIVLPGLLMWRYRSALKVYLQLDDGSRNLQWWWDLVRWRRGRKEQEEEEGEGEARRNLMDRSNPA